MCKSISKLAIYCILINQNLRPINNLYYNWTEVNLVLIADERHALYHGDIIPKAKMLV